MKAGTDLAQIASLVGDPARANMLAALMGGPLTGASMNPARSLGPALVSGDLSQFGVYVVGPLAGALLGAVVYSWIQRCRDEPVEGASGCC